MKRILSSLPLLIAGQILAPGFASPTLSSLFTASAQESASEISLEEVEKQLKENDDFAPAGETIPLSLQEAISRGLRQNNLQKERDYRKEIIQLNWDDAYQSFWYPNLSLTVSAGPSLAQSFYSENDVEALPSTPSGFVGLEFEDYTVFNWGRDYLDYLNSQALYTRRNQELVEQRRALRFQIIDQYFNLSRAKRVRLIKKSQLRHTSFIYRLSREKLDLGRIPRQEFMQAKEEFLRSHKEFQQSSEEVAEQEELMAQLLGDELTAGYSLVNQLRFTSLTIKKEESLAFAGERNPGVLEAKTQLQNSNRSYEKIRKDNLPLPKFSVKLGAYRNRFSSAGAADNYTTYDDGNNIELAASLNAKWTIFGSGGFLNSRDKERAYFSKRIAEINFYESKREMVSAISTLHRRIQRLEHRIEAAQARLKNARALFDLALDRYISGSTTFPNMKLSLDALILSEEDLENAKYEHLAQKLNLANAAGIDDFPGEKFDNLVLQ